ncbi:DUF2065 family protein [candidate division NPL-UPA2 bacterium]|nr:DUF2065 family protein [candidate division NPL-UPA2 bacterium]
MPSIIADIFTFIVDEGRILILVISIAVLIEGLLYLFFPQKVKKIIKECPLFLFRVLGGLVVIVGLLLLYLYVEILSYGS